jgi:hypothetical protein
MPDHRLPKNMKRIFLPLCHSSLRARGFLLSSVLLLLISAGACGAQELLKNKDFEDPFPGTDPASNWIVVFQEGGPGDFDIAGPSTESAYPYGVSPTWAPEGGNGAHLRNVAPRWTTKAYFKQLVTNLTVGAKYTLTLKKMKRGDYANLYIWAALVSGSVSNTVFGDSTVTGPYSLSITAATTQVSVQLHLTKNSLIPDEAGDDYRSINCWGHFDACSLTLTP